MDLTVVIPSYQRRDHLSELLASLATSFPPERRDGVEVVVVLDGSTDGSYEMLQALAEEYPLALRPVQQSNAGAATARNHGVRVARGELVWFIDDDLRASPGAAVAHLSHPRTHAPVAMGACLIRSDDPTAAVAAEWYDERWDRLAVSRRITNPIDLTFANASMPVELARQHTFQERFHGYGAEDLELSIRMLADGVVAEYLPDAALIHAYSPSADERLRKLRQEGTNRRLLCELHPDAKDLIATPQGKFERIIAVVAGRRWSDKLLWGLARSISYVGRAPLPGRVRANAQRLAEVAALHAGLARA